MFKPISRAVLFGCAIALYWFLVDRLLAFIFFLDSLDFFNGCGALALVTGVLFISLVWKLSRIN